MNNNIDYRKYIEDTLCWARSKGLCHTKAEFARLVGVNPATISATKHARYSGKITARKIEAWRLSVEGEIAPKIGEQQIEWKEFRMAAAKDILCSLVSPDDNVYRQKQEEAVRTAIMFADELVRQLKNG